MDVARSTFGDAASRPAQRLRRLLRSRILAPAIDEQIREELDLHVELLVRDLRESGLSERDAREEAVRRFADREAVVASCRRLARGTERRLRIAIAWDELRQDVVYGLRQLARDRAFTAVALLTLAAGLGATTAIWSVVQSVVLRQLPFAHPDRVMIVREVNRQGDSNVASGNFVDWGEIPAFRRMAVIQRTPLNLTGNDRPERLFALRASAGFFEVFGVPPLFGRTFTTQEDRPGHDDVTVLSYALWRRRFAGERTVLGRSIQLSGRAYRIIGVMPAAFDPILLEEDLYLPIAFTPEQRARHDGHLLGVVGLLRPGVSPDVAQTEIAAAFQPITRRHPHENLGVRGAHVLPLAEFLLGPYRQRLFVLLGAVGLVLLIACANVASLLLARGSARSREIAIRAAIGAGRGRLVRQLLAESAVLAAISAILGVGVAALLVRLFVSLAPPDIPRFGDTRIDVPVLLFALGLAFAASLLFGVVPAVRVARQEPYRMLKEGEVGGGRGRDRLRSGLVLVEVALALTLLVGAGLLLRSTFELQRVPLGFATDHLVTARLSLPEASYPTGESMARAIDRVVESVGRAPGVSVAAATSAAPLGRSAGGNGMVAEGKPMRLENLVMAELHLVTPGYFKAFGIPLLRGRGFTPRDEADRERVTIISRALAKRLFGDIDPLGKRVECCDGPEGLYRKTVIGVAADLRSRGPGEPLEPEFYLPMRQAPPSAWRWNQRSMVIVVRGSDASRSIAALRGAVHAVDATLPLSEVGSMREAFRGSLAQSRFYTVLLLCLGGLGLLLAAVGIYGVLAYFVSLRTREIAIRVALGATRGRIVALFTRQGAVPLVGGLALGTIGASAATRWVQGSLYGVTPTDPWTFGVVVLLILVTGWLAILVPALRATRIAPGRAGKGRV